jgi:hypothetical protein
MPEAQIPADEPAHDVLAAEEFAVPAPDPSLHHGPVILPDDPSGIEEPHDVLAAEEFAMPAPVSRSSEGGIKRGQGPAPLVLGALLLIAVLMFRTARRRV